MYISLLLALRFLFNHQTYLTIIYCYICANIHNVLHLGMHFKEKYANNVLFNLKATIWRCWKRCALLCDVIITDVNKWTIGQKGVPDSLYQTATPSIRQPRAVPDRKSRNPSSGGIFLSQVREKVFFTSTMYVTLVYTQVRLTCSGQNNLA